MKKSNYCKKPHKKPPKKHKYYELDVVLQASYALKFIQRQLVELSMQCETTVQRELVSSSQSSRTNLEKLLHEVCVSISTMFLFSKQILKNTHIPLFIVNTLLQLVIYNRDFVSFVCLIQTRSVCCPPPRKPEDGDVVTIKRFSGGSFG